MSPIEQQIFSDVAARNAQRRAAGLPLLDLKFEYDKAMHEAKAMAYANLRIAHKGVLDEIYWRHASRYAVGEIPTGFAGSSLVHYKVALVFERYLRRYHGGENPVTSSARILRYGG